jgi:hypothetical protein
MKHTIEPKNQFHKFCVKMWELNIVIASISTQPTDLINRHDLTVWICPNGECFITQHWKEGSYEVYYPSKENQVDNVYHEAARFAGIEKGNVHDQLLEALEGLFEHCEMVHKHWGEGCNQREADTAIAKARAAIAKATGKD